MKNPLSQETASHIANFLTELPELTPATIQAQISKAGYVGQENAQKALALMAFRHINRLKNLFVKETPLSQLPPKDNFLLIGPTGCGKTYLIELLFQHILQLPTVIIDISAYSETGYVGQDAVSMLTRLIYAAQRDTALASIGIVCIDEFDKLSSGKKQCRIFWRRHYQRRGRYWGATRTPQNVGGFNP